MDIMIIQLQKIFLIFLRITSFIVVTPAFSFKGLPNIYKVGLSSVLSFFAYMIVPEMAIESEMFSFFLLAIKETAFGLAIGFVTKLIFSAIETAGHLIDFQVGFSMGSVYDPSLGVQASNYGILYYWMAICALFLLDLHHLLIAAIIKSFQLVPLSTINIDGLSVDAVLSIFSKVFELGLNLAAPMIIVVLITDVVLAVISRTVPQINVLILGMPLKAMVSFVAAMVSISWILSSMGNILKLIPQYLEGFVRLF